MKKAFILLCTLISLGLASAPASRAETACSTVKIEILQELTLERIAFDAKLKVTNNMPDKDLTDMRVDIIVRDALGNDETEQFFVRAPECTGVSNVSGTGVVAQSSVAEAHWLIIPSPGAGGQELDGVRYWVGATMSYKVDGVTQTVPVECSGPRTNAS